jgi:hypothetical protein
MGWVAADPIDAKSDTDLREQIAQHAYEALSLLSRRRAVGDTLKRFTRILTGFKVGASTDGNYRVLV